MKDNGDINCVECMTVGVLELRNLATFINEAMNCSMPIDLMVINRDGHSGNDWWAPHGGDGL